MADSMELVERLDTVFNCLAEYSHDDPNFPKLKNWLLPYKLDEGEIDDCLKKLYLDGHIYFQDNEKKGNPSDVVGFMYNRHLNYLISLNGKLFRKNEGSYKAYYKRLSDEKIATSESNQRMERNAELLVTWTENLATRTQNLTTQTSNLVWWTRLVAIGALGLVVWEIIDHFLKHEK